jgi:hypothetical protein
MMEMLLLSFNQVRRHRKQLTPLQLQQYKPLKTHQQQAIVIPGSNENFGKNED